MDSRCQVGAAEHSSFIKNNDNPLKTQTQAPLLRFRFQERIRRKTPFSQRKSQRFFQRQLVVAWHRTKERSLPPCRSYGGSLLDLWRGQTRRGFFPSPSKELLWPIRAPWFGNTPSRIFPNLMGLRGFFPGFWAPPIGNPSAKAGKPAPSVPITKLP